MRIIATVKAAASQN